MLPAVMAGISIASSVAGMAGGLSANKNAREATRQQARNTYAQRMEEIRRQRVENEYTQGYNVAAIGASGIQMSGSSARHLAGMQQEMSRDISWRRMSASQERRAIRAGAPGGAANLATVAQGVGSIASTLYDYNT